MKQISKKEKVILIYTRPWFVDFYTVLASKIEADFKFRVIFFSDYRMKNVFNISPKKNRIKNFSSCSEEEYFDIIKRDRVLRNEPVEYANALLKAYKANIASLFEQYNVQFVFSATVDQFAIDMCYKYCLEAKIPFIGYHLSVIPGYTLLTARGEIYNFRKPPNFEILAAADLISPKSFRPEYIPQKGKLRLVGFKRFLANIARVPYFFTKDIFETRYNYHYKASLKSAYLSIDVSVLKSLIKYKNISKELEDIDIYIPLQLHPECNSEYWNRDSIYQDYEDLIFKFCKKYAKSFKICIKEHPNMIGVRSDNFLKKFKANGVIIADFETDNRKLIDNAKITVTLNSSVGIEGLLRGASVMCLGKPYYLTEGHITKEQQMLNILKGDQVISKQKIRNRYLYQAISQTLAMSIPVALPDTPKLLKNMTLMEIEKKAITFTSDLKKYFRKITEAELSNKNVFTYKESKDV